MGSPRRADAAAVRRPRLPLRARTVRDRCDRADGRPARRVSILDQGQEPASRHFAGQAVADFAPAFAELGGVPVLAAAAVTLAPRIKHRYDCGDHTVFVGEVQELAVNEAAPPLLYYEGRSGMLQAVRRPPGGNPEPYPSFF